MRYVVIQIVNDPEIEPEDEFIEGVYGPFDSEREATDWIPKTDRNYLYSVQEVTDPIDA